MKNLFNSKMKILVLGLFYLAIFPRTAFAYLDPGSGSFIIQLIIGVLAGLIMVIKVYWGKIKAFFGHLFSKNSALDENQVNE